MIEGSAMIEGGIAGAVIERAAAGDEVAFARIVAAHHEDMARIAFLVSGDLDVAADAEQAAWAIAWRRLGTLRDAARLKPWLMSVAANEARQIMRSQRRRTVRELAVEGPATSIRPRPVGPHRSRQRPGRPRPPGSDPDRPALHRRARLGSHRP